MSTKYHKCFGCSTQIADTPGNAYCNPCVDRQLQAQHAERVAFDAFHRYADAVARAGKPGR